MSHASNRAVTIGKKKDADMADDAWIAITHETRGKGGRYIAQIEGEAYKGHLDWEPTGDPNIRTATHTIVPPEIGGRGIAALLAKRLMADAREHGFRVIPQCWYVAKKFDKNPEWADLRA